MGITEKPMLTEAFRPLTPEVYNDVVETCPTLIIEGVVFRAYIDGRGRPAWRGADGRTVSLNRLDDIMDAEIAVSYLPSRQSDERIV
jgi:hypothetical protein